MMLQVRTESNETFIAMYETERTEPNEEDYFHLDNGKQLYEEAFFEWQSSKREYKVRKEDEDLLIEELYDHYHKDYSGDRLDEMLNSEGIDCTFLKYRLKLEECLGEGWVPSYNDPDNIGCHPNAEPELMWTLLPLEDKKENEAEKEEFLNYMYTEMGMISGDYDNDQLWEILNRKYTITRKPTIQEPE